MKKITQAWLDAAQDDLLAIERLIGDEALTNVVSFHAQQCVEKSFKALVEESEVPVRKTHSLVQLLGMVSTAYDELSDMDTTVLNLLDQLYTDSRYPNEFGLLPDGKPTLEEAGLFQRFATEVHDKKIPESGAGSVRNLNSDFGITDVPCFHAQQPVEKALKRTGRTGKGSQNHGRQNDFSAQAELPGMRQHPE